METNSTSWHAVNPVLVDAPRSLHIQLLFFRTIPENRDYFFNKSSFRPRPEQTFRRALDSLKHKLIQKKYGEPLKKWILVTALYSPLALANETTDFQTWWTSTLIGTLYQDHKPTRVKYWLEGQERVGEDCTKSSQTIFRPGVGYMLNSQTSIWFGYAWVDTGIPLAPLTSPRAKTMATTILG